MHDDFWVSLTANPCRLLIYNGYLYLLELVIIRFALNNILDKFILLYYYSHDIIVGS